jgi:hypothetical protein
VFIKLFPHNAFVKGKINKLFYLPTTSKKCKREFIIAFIMQTLGKQQIIHEKKGNVHDYCMGYFTEIANNIKY